MVASRVESAAAVGAWSGNQSDVASRAIPTVRELVDVVGVSIVVAAGLGLLTTSIVLPTIFGDELTYWEAARSLADGNGLSVREAGYGYGPLYPAMLAPILHLAATADAYAIAKVLNAALYASAAIPIYLLARKFVDHRWSVLVAALSVVGPTSVYAGFVLTESAAYAAWSWAVLGIVAALETPSVRRQALALLSVAIATAVRPQLVVLGPALLAAYVGYALLSPPGTHVAYAKQLRPTALVTALAAGAAGFWTLVGSSSVLGAYSVLASAHFDVAEVLVWTWWTLGVMTLQVAAVPVVAGVAVLSELRASSRAGSSRSRAMLMTLVCTSGALLASIGLFSASGWGNGVLHERYVFYVVPLWLLGVAWWARSGGVARRRQLAIGAALAASLLMTLPPGLQWPHGTIWLQWPSVSPWSLLGVFVPLTPGAFWVAVAVLVVPVTLALVTVAIRRPLFALLPVAVAFAAATTLTWSWRSVVSHLDDADYGRNFGVEWVDAAIGPRSRATTLFTGSERCQELAWVRALLYAEFGNAAVGPALHLEERSAPVIQSTEVGVDGRGYLLADRRRVNADFVLTPSGVPVAGEKVASAPDGRVDLYAVHGPIRVRGAASAADVLRTACRSSAR